MYFFVNCAGLLTLLYWLSFIFIFYLYNYACDTLYVAFHCVFSSEALISYIVGIVVQTLALNKQSADLPGCVITTCFTLFFGYGCVSFLRSFTEPPHILV